jgi:hypothetical protein
MAKNQASESSGTTFLGKLFILAVVAGCFYLAYRKFFAPGAPPPPDVAADAGLSGPPPASPSVVEVGVAYGTEKKNWLEWAVKEFSGTEQGKGISVKLIPMGSLKAAHTLVAPEGDAKKIHAWSPASALYKDIFVTEWKDKNGKSPILREEPLALSPMVFVFWAERYRAFTAKYSSVSFSTIGEALREKGGWNAIARQPDWGLFKFGHAHPNESNSGLMTLVLMACEFSGKSRDLGLKDILDTKFQAWMGDVERAASGMQGSTGDMMRDMVLKGPSTYDALFVYESVVIDYLKQAEGRWDGLYVIYPKLNMWNDNPYYVLDVPWSTAAHRQAAERFLAFLLSEPIQRKAIEHGFRPANANVSVKAPDSPFTIYEQKYGLKIDLTSMVEPPRAEVINNLLASWERSRGSR